MRAGQGGGELDLAEGGRGRLHRARPRSCAATAPPSWSWPSTKRARPTRSSARSTIATRAYDILVNRRRLSAGGHHLRSEHLRGRDRHRGAQRLRRRLHRGDALDQAEPAARPRLRRRLQPLLLVPRQRAGARGDALGVSLSRHRRRHGHGHRQCRPARGLRRHRSRTARGVRGRRAQPPRRRDRAAARARRTLSRRTARRRRRPISPGANGRWRSGCRTRWCTASPTSSRSTSRKRAPRRRARSP